MDVPLTLALEDLVPTLLSGAAYAVVSTAVARRSGGAGRLAWAGTILLVAGGLSRGTWKLVLAMDGPDLLVVEALLFPLLASGFALLAAALWSVRDATHTGPGRATLSAVLGIVAGCAALGLLIAGGTAAARPAELVLIAVATVGNTMTALLLVRAALAVPSRLAATAIALNLATVFLLAGLARIDAQSVPLQVVEQGINTVSQALLLLAVLRLSDAWRARGIGVPQRMAGAPSPAGSEGDPGLDPPGA
jgi:hypothetical protein